MSEYRSWSKTYNRMLYVTSMNFEYDSLSGKDSDGKIYHQPKPKEKGVLMRNLGIVDREQKEIYEGDILRSIEDPTFIFEVKELIPIDRFYFNHPAPKMDDWMSMSEMYEVVGNKFETPDLLKEQTNV